MTAGGVEVVPGRDGTSRGMMTMGCSGLGCASAICVAVASGYQCSFCIRKGAFPAPAWWRDAASIVTLSRPSVQIVPIAEQRLRWGVIVLLERQYVNGQFPIVGAADADRAIDAALVRGRQLQPKAKIEQIGPGQWRAGVVDILCGPAFRHARRWKG